MQCVIAGLDPAIHAAASAQADDETAKTGALDICQKRADALPQQRKCELYAVGATLIELVVIVCPSGN
jgi:hypothetical protein